MYKLTLKLFFNSTEYKNVSNFFIVKNNIIKSTLVIILNLSNKLFNILYTYILLGTDLSQIKKYIIFNANLTNLMYYLHRITKKVHMT